jgi:hypothetical protein
VVRKKNGVSVYLKRCRWWHAGDKSIVKGSLVMTSFLLRQSSMEPVTIYLTRMSKEHLCFEDVLKQAQQTVMLKLTLRLISAAETRHKVAILASLISNGYVPYDKISIEGSHRSALMISALHMSLV